MTLFKCIIPSIYYLIKLQGNNRQVIKILSIISLLPILEYKNYALRMSHNTGLGGSNFPASVCKLRDVGRNELAVLLADVVHRRLAVQTSGCLAHLVTLALVDVFQGVESVVKATIDHRSF